MASSTSFVLGERLEVARRRRSCRGPRRPTSRSRRSSGSRSIRFSTACWIVAGSASAEISASAGEAPGAGVVPGDAARLDERADELLREEGVALRRVAEPLDEARRRAFGAADQRLDERAVLGGREAARASDRDEAPVVREALEHPGERVARVDLGRAVAADDERRRRARGGGRCTASASIETSAPWRSSRMSTRGLPAGDPRQRPGEQLEDLGPVLRPSSRGRARDARVAARRGRGSRRSRRAREEGDQVRREVREVGALAALAGVRGSGSSPG